MPLQKQLIETPLSTGLNQQSDVRSLVTSGAVAMTNCVVLKNGAIRKRAGNVTLAKSVLTNGAASGTLAASVAGGSLSGAPWLSDGTFLYSYSDASGSFSKLDLLPEAVCLDRIPVDTGAQNISDMDIATVSDPITGRAYLYVAYCVNNTTIYVVVLDASTGAVVTPPRGAALGGAPKLVSFGTTVGLFYTDSSALRVLLQTAPQVSTGFGVIVTTTSSGFAGQPFDAVPVVGDPTRAFAAIEAASGTIKCMTVSASTGGALVTRNVSMGASISSAKSIGARATNAETMWVIYTPVAPGPANQATIFALNDDGTLSVRGASLVLFSLAGTDWRGRCGVERIDANNACAVWSQTWSFGGSSIANAWVMAQNVVISAGACATNGGSYYTGGAVLLSRPTLVGSLCYATVVTPSSLQGTIYLAAIDGYNNGPNSMASGTLWGANALRPVATVAPRLAKQMTLPGLFAGGSVATSLANASGSVWSTVGLISTGPTTQAMYVYPFDFANTSRYRSGELSLDETLSAGEPQVNDGNNAFAAGFEFYPEVISGVMAGSGGSLSAGQYQFAVTYVTSDSRGQVHESSPGNVITLTAAANDKCTLSIPILGFTTRRTKSANLLMQSQTYARVYRTTVGGSVLYRVADVAFPNNPSFASAATAQNVVTYADGAADASINTNGLLPTTGGVLANFNPPSSRICVAHRNRFWLAGCDDPTQLWASTEFIQGTYPYFCESLLQNASGSIRALASMDDKLILFVQRGATYGIEYLSGDGPTATGTSNDWSPLQPIPSDTGAVDQRSVCSGPFGVLFRGTTGGPLGKGGIFLLSRDLQVKYVGGPVEDQFALFPNVTSMLLHPTNGRVYITCVDSDASPFSGTRLVWDYTRGGVWSIDLLTDPDTGNNQAASRCAWVANTATQGVAYHWATTSGRVYRETTGDPTVANAMLDAGSWVTATFSSAWLKPSLAGFARFWRVLLQSDALSPANLNVRLTFDYNPASSYSELGSWTAAQAGAFPQYPRVTVQLAPGNQKSEAIQVTLSDATPTGGPGVGSGAGYSWATLTLELGVKPGRYQNVPVAQRK